MTPVGPAAEDVGDLIDQLGKHGMLVVEAAGRAYAADLELVVRRTPTSSAMCRSTQGVWWQEDSPRG